MSFAVPLFLLAMLAGLIPVLLHMIRQQQSKTVPFGTLRFLRLGAQKTRRRKYFHDILLLSLRAAALMLIALALAQPTLTHIGRLLGRDDSSAVVLILDNSSSMSTVDVGGSRWETALATTQEILDQLDDRDSVALLLTCGPPRPALSRLYPNQDVIRQTLAECRVSYERADLVGQLRVAEKVLAGSDAAHKEIYVITDMQTASWDASNASEPVAANPDIPSVILVDVHREQLANVALADVSLQSAGPIAGMPMQATVRLLGDLKLDQQRNVELLIDDQTIQISPTITVGAGATAEYAFDFSVDRPGIHTAMVRLASDDACVADNQRLCAVPVARNIPVAVVKPNEHDVDYQQDSFYLERALVPVADGNWAIQIDSLLPGALAAASLQKYAVIFCVNLPAVDSSVAVRLRDYVRGGGHLVWICGDNVDVAPYRTMDQSAGDELLPAPLGGLRESDPTESQGWNIGWIDAAHPALSTFAQPQSLYQSVLVSKHFATEQVDPTQTRVLARLNDGQPLLLERRVGSGSVLLLGTSVHVDWSNLPLRPLFLPLVQRLTFYLADANAAQRQLPAGAVIPIIQPGSRSTEPGISNVSYEVIRPDGDVVREIGAQQGSDGLQYTDTHDIGIYKIRGVGGGDQREIAVAINLDPDEIPAAIASLDSVASIIGPDRLVVCRDPPKVAATIGELRQGKSLMEYFLIAVLIILIGESYVANRRVDQEQPDELREVRSVQPAYRRLPDHLEGVSIQGAWTEDHRTR